MGWKRNGEEMVEPGGAISEGDGIDSLCERDVTKKHIEDLINRR